MLKLQTKTLSGEYAHVFSGDDALDTSREGFAEAFAKAQETGDYGHLTKPNCGDKLQPITLRRFRGRKRRRFRGLMLAAKNREEAIFDAARLVIVCVHGHELATEHDPEWDEEVLTEESLAQLDEIDGLINEIAMRALEEHTIKKK